MNDVCSIELLRNAVGRGLSADEEAALHAHLEHCEACCAQMEQLAGGEAWQQEAAALLSADELDAAVPEPTNWSEVDFSVEHLDPSDDANVLGRLGGYDVLAIVGRGGMGVVLKAFDHELKRLVAIKALAPHLAHSSVARKRFAREAQAAAAVVNPHVIAIHHVQPTGRLPFLIMPLLTGESLAQRLKARGPLELTEVLRIGMQAANGLAAAHDQGLVHRDVKPANIFLEKGVERVVITDFGLARAADDVSMTRQGVVAGTPEYMSPEQARGEALDGRSDLFSLGCVLYEMATGVSPFRTDSTMATLRRIVDEQPAAMASLVPELPPWFSHIVERLLSKDPAQRFASASEVSQLLEQCLSHLQQPTSVPLPASLVPHAAGRRSIFKVTRKGVIAMLGTIGMTLLGLVLLQATEAPDISGQWTSDEWGTVVLEAKGSGEYDGTFTGTGKDKPAPSNEPPGGGPGGGPLGFGVSPKSGYDALNDSDKTKSGSLDSKSFQSLNNPPGLGPGAGSGLPGVPGARPVPMADSVPAGGGGLGGTMPGGPSTAIDSGKGKSGTVHLKWSRVERRFNGTWGKGAARKGTMSLRLVDKEIRGGWTTDEDVQLETGTPLVGDLLWKRSSENAAKDAEPSIGKSLQGKIDRVDPERNLAWINLGTADGVTLGMTFEVRPNAAEYVEGRVQVNGSLEVISIQDQHMSKARILKEDSKYKLKSNDDVFNVIDPKSLAAAAKRFNSETAEVRSQLFAPPIPDLTVERLREGFRQTATYYRGLGKRQVADALEKIAESGQLPNEAMSELIGSGVYAQDEKGMTIYRQVVPALVLPDDTTSTGNSLVVLRPLELMFRKDGPVSKDYGDQFAQDTAKIPATEKPKPLDRQNARAVVEAFVAAALAGDRETVITLAKRDRRDPKRVSERIENMIKYLPDREHLPMTSVHVNDAANPSVAIAISDQFKWENPGSERKTDRPDEVAWFTLSMSEAGWIVTDISIEWIESTDGMLKKFLEANPKAINVPPQASSETARSPKGLAEAKERRDVLLQRVALLEKSLAASETDPETVLTARDQLFQAELQLVTTKEERLTLYQKRLECMRANEKLVKQIFDAKECSQDAMLSATAARLQAEIDLARAGETVPGIKKPLDRQNARAVVEAFVAATFPFDDATFNTLARLRDRSEAGVEALDDLKVARLPIQSVYVNDPAKPTRALATSEAVRLEDKLTKHGQRNSILVFTLTMSDEGWLVTDIDIESEESADRELKKFLEANPNAISLPPLTANAVEATHTKLPVTKESSEYRVTLLGLTRAVSPEFTTADGLSGGNRPLSWMRAVAMIERLGEMDGPYGFDAQATDGQKQIEKLKVRSTSELDLDSSHLARELSPITVPKLAPAARGKIYMFTISGVFQATDLATLRFQFGTPARQQEVVFENVPIPAVEKVTGIKQPLDRKNARAVVTFFVTAALAGYGEEARKLAGNLAPADMTELAAVAQRVPGQIVTPLAIAHVYVNDLDMPTSALAISERVSRTGERDSFLLLTLSLNEEGWFVTDIDFESEESADRELKKFLEANPNAISVPPQASSEAAMKRTLDALVTVTFSGTIDNAGVGSTGIGWVVDDAGHILLPSHVASECDNETIVLRYANGARCPAKRLKTSGQLTLLQSENIATVPVISLNTKVSLANGDAVSGILNGTDIVHGSITDARKTVVFSEMAGVKISPPLRFTNIISTDIKRDAASLSGAPLLTKTGDVAGMTILLREGALLAIPVAEIRMTWEQFQSTGGNVQSWNEPVEATSLVDSTTVNPAPQQKSGMPTHLPRTETEYTMLDFIRDEAYSHVEDITSLQYAFEVKDDNGWHAQSQFFADRSRFRVNRKDVAGMLVMGKRLEPMTISSAFDGTRQQYLDSNGRLRLKNGCEGASYGIGTPHLEMYSWLRRGRGDFRWDTICDKELWKQRFAEAEYIGGMPDNGRMLEIVDFPQRLEGMKPCAYRVIFARDLRFLPIKILRRVSATTETSTTVMVTDFKSIEKGDKRFVLPTALTYTESRADGVSLKQQRTTTVALDSLKVNEPIDEAVFTIDRKDAKEEYDVDQQEAVLGAEKVSVIEQPLDRQNARSVVDAFVAAALAGDKETTKTLTRDLPPANISSLSEFFADRKMTRLPIQSVYVNDPAKPTRALATSESVTLDAEPQPPNSEYRFSVVFTLIMGEEGWSVSDITDEEVENDRSKLKKFLEANPNAISVPPRASSEAAKPATGLAEAKTVDTAPDGKPTEKSETSTELPPLPNKAIPLIEKPKVDKGQESDKPLPIEGHRRNPKLPIDRYVKSGVPLAEQTWPMPPWGAEKGGLSAGLRVIGDAHIGGEVKAELWVRNSSAKDVKFSQCLRADVGLSVVAKDKDGKEHSADITQFRGYPVFHHLLLPPGHIVKVKEFNVKFGAGKNDNLERRWVNLQLTPGDYKLHAVWSDTTSRGAAEGEWTGKLTTGDVDFKLAAAEAGADAGKPAAKPPGATAVDRRNARSVVEAYVSAALASDVAKAAALAKNAPADPKRIAEIPKQLNVKRLAMKSVYVNDPAKPVTALATSEAVKLTKKQPDGQRDGFLVLTLTMSEIGWFVTDIDFESEEGAEDELKRFREANPSAVDVPTRGVQHEDE